MLPIEQTSGVLRKGYKSRNLPRGGLLEPYSEDEKNKWSYS
jgi:hypothetical protein